MSYGPLLVRAGISKAPEKSEFTSIRERIQNYQNKDRKQENHSELLKFKDASDEILTPPDPLEKAGSMHEEEVMPCCKKEIPINFQEYLELISREKSSIVKAYENRILLGVPFIFLAKMRIHKT